MNARTVALLGQPNSGKSTLFNALTGSRQRVGNWPGKTVEKKEGSFSRDGVDFTVCDLPGTYSLSANSEEEVVTRDYIASGKADAVCVLADASQLERSLYMLADFVGVDCPCVLVLNLMDVAEGQGKRIDAAAVERATGVPVVPFVAADRKGYEAFYQALERAIDERLTLDATPLAAACRANSARSTTRCAHSCLLRASGSWGRRGSSRSCWKATLPLARRWRTYWMPRTAGIWMRPSRRWSAACSAWARAGSPGSTTRSRARCADRAQARRSRGSTASPQGRAGASRWPSALSCWGFWPRSSRRFPS
ncbi:FeoB small GTPase domain-containing protein [Eggerthella sinensis]|uniref:FeoB small GTPase domain-containing protein n=1 Tax=Eggerthella sinensis TaxID=242230 RepID=UPI003A4D9C44